MSYIVTDINQSGNDLSKIKTLISDLNTEQQNLVISSSNLNAVEKTKLGILNGSASIINANTLATTTNTTANKAQTLSEEDELAQRWLSITAEETDTAATTANTAAKSTNLSVTNLLKVAWAKLTAVITKNPMIAAGVASTAVLTGIIVAYNKLHPSLEQASKDLKEQQEAFDTVTSEVTTLSEELQTAKDRLEELQSKGSLSLVENEELSKLKETTAELEAQLAIKKQEQRLEAKKTADIADKAFNGSFRSKFDDNGDLITGDAVHSNDAVKELENSIKAYYKLQEQYNEAKKNADFFIKETEKNGGRYSLTGKVDYAEYEKYAKQMESIQKDMDNVSTHAQSMYEAINGQKKAYEGLSDAGYDLRQDQLDEYQIVRESANAYNEFCQDINDTAKAFSELSAEQKRSKLESNLVLSGQSENSAKEIVASLSDDELDVAAGLTFNYTDTVESVQEAIKVAQEEADKEGGIEISFDLATYEEDIDDIQSSISSLRSALDSFNTGDLTEKDVLDLMQQFPALVPYVDLAAEGFGNLSQGLSDLIAQQPDYLINSLELLKATLNTDEERAQIDELINSLQLLSSYGDTGAEAYATAIGSTWSDTANVIESVTTQFENLALVQEAVANGLTMSATAAAELAQTYPEILTNATVAANGQVTLNEDVVKSILAGDQSIINSQITKLEADKAVLTAKQEAAEAELNILQQVGTAHGQISEETAKKEISDIEQKLEATIEALNQENQAYAGTIENMSENAEQFDLYAAEVANDLATNMNAAAASMAEGMSINSIASQMSLAGIIKKAADVAIAIIGMKNGETVSNPDAIYNTSSGSNSGGISTTTTRSNYTATARDYVAGNISFDEFRSSLQLDIDEYKKAISNIDTQIEILKNLQTTFNETANSANGGIGSHNYADKIKDLEKEKDKINSALDDDSGSTKKTKDEYKELFDFFERRLNVLQDAYDLLNANINNVIGSAAKNTLIDAQAGILEERFRNYSDAINMYQQKADEALSKLDGSIQEKIKNGAVDLTTFIGEGNEDVVDAINDYEQWADKVADCKQELAELKEEIRQLELAKFNNIIEDYTNQFDLYDDSISLIDKQIALFEEAGQLIGESFYSKQIEQSQKQLNTLEAEKVKLVEQLNSALNSGRVNLCPAA